MCASLLRQFHIRTVYFGAANERFGGTGGVLSIHADQGVERGYQVYGGIFREECVMLLRRFYVQDNEKVPDEKVSFFFVSLVWLFFGGRSCGGGGGGANLDCS